MSVEKILYLYRYMGERTPKYNTHKETRPMSLPELTALRKSTFLKYRAAFLSTFHVQLNAYFSIVFGFDVVKFDELLRPPDGTSLKDHIQKMYGPEALALVENILHDR